MLGHQPDRSAQGVLDGAIDGSLHCVHGQLDVSNSVCQLGDFAGLRDKPRMNSWHNSLEAVVKRIVVLGSFQLLFDLHSKRLKDDIAIVDVVFCDLQRREKCETRGGR